MAFCSPNLWSKSWLNMAAHGKRMGEIWRHWRHGSRAPELQASKGGKRIGGAKSSSWGSLLGHEGPL